MEKHAGDLCSALGVAGAIGIVASWPFRTRTERPLENVAKLLVIASMGAAAVDTSIQGYNVATGRRGEKDSDGKSIAYAATGMIPAVSLGVMGKVGHVHTKGDAARAGIVVLASGVLAGELAIRGPRVLSGEETLSGMGSLAAAAGGFIVARHALSVPGPAFLGRFPHDAHRLLRVLHPRG